MKLGGEESRLSLVCETSVRERMDVWIIYISNGLTAFDNDKYHILTT